MTLDERATNIGPAGIEIAYRRLGNPQDPPVVLIMGLSGQLIHWPEALCAVLVDRGLQAICFDNRDSGLSTHLKDAPPANLQAALAGDLSSVPYTLSDMAGDTVGLLDYLGIAKAHIVGASMGGRIAQIVAIEHPDRVRSLISMMSSTGSKRVGQPDPEALRAVFSGPRAVTRDDAVRLMIRASKVVGSPGYPTDEEQTAALAGRAYDRSYDPEGSTRQAVASVAAGDSTERLRQLKVPTLVIHGLADRMVDVSGGRATAEAIPGAELILIEGMGHNMPPGLRPQLAAHIADFVWRVERG